VRDKPFYQGLLTLLAGPERIEAGWWDDALETRDYFIAENERHMLLWIFRERPLAEKPEAGWFLHGFFG
jgi:protein ImuB